MNTFTKQDLMRFQAESLYDKEQRSLAKVSQWYNYWHDEVYVAFSGGKDSSVLSDICGFWCSLHGITLYLCYVDTGLEYPEIRRHVKDYAEYLRQKYKIEVVLDIVRPKMRFDEVIKKYGYPMISKEVSKCVSSAKRLDSKYGQICRSRLEGTHTQKSGETSLYNCAKYKPLLDMDFDVSHRCCDIMKKTPSHEYAKRTGRKPITAQMACESRLREQQWIKHGCNGFDMATPTSNPMSFWTEQDVLQYIKKYEIPIASVYGDIVYANDTDQLRIEDYGIECEGSEKLCTTGCERTGCIFCGFGCHREKSPSRFELLKRTHPRQYEYCIGGGEYVWIGEHKHLDGSWGEFDLINENGEPMSETEVVAFMESYKGNENYRFKKVWQPNKQGLGLGHVFDELNKVYGEGFIKF